MDVFTILFQPTITIISTTITFQFSPHLNMIIRSPLWFKELQDKGHRQHVADILTMVNDKVPITITVLNHCNHFQIIFNMVLVNYMHSLDPWDWFCSSISPVISFTIIITMLIIFKVGTNPNLTINLITGDELQARLPQRTRVSAKAQSWFLSQKIWQPWLYPDICIWVYLDKTRSKNITWPPSGISPPWAKSSSFKGPKRAQRSNNCFDIIFLFISTPSILCLAIFITLTSFKTHFYYLNLDTSISSAVLGSP